MKPTKKTTNHVATQQIPIDGGKKLKPTRVNQHAITRNINFTRSDDDDDDNDDNVYM